MHLSPHVRPDLTFVLQGCSSPSDALREAIRNAAGQLPGLDPDDTVEQLLSRENQYPTATQEGVAYPHLLLAGVEDTVILVCLLRPGIKWSARVDADQDLMFVMIGPDSKPWQHVRLLARLARIACAEGALDRLRGAEDARELFERLTREDGAHD